MTEQSFEFDVIKVNSQGEIIQRTKQQNRYFIEELGEGVSCCVVGHGLVLRVVAVEQLAVVLKWNIVLAGWG